MKARERFIEHLKQKGAIPKNYMCGGRAKYAKGGMVEPEIEIEIEYGPEDQDEEFGHMSWEDDYNYHYDTSGSPKPAAKTFEPEKAVTENEVKKYMAQSIAMRKGRR